MPIPDVLIDYFIRYIQDVLYTPSALFRYFSPAESALWVGYSGYDMDKSGFKKMSATIFPVLCSMAIAEERAGFIVFNSSQLQEARAVSYTHYYDPITEDALFPYEYEFAVYGETKPESRAPSVERVPLTMGLINFVRLLRNAVLSESELKRAKVLPSYVHGRAYARYNHTLVPRHILIKYLAVTTTLYLDKKMLWAFGYAWDMYWQEHDLLAYPPNYATAELMFETYKYKPPSRYDAKNVCGNSFIDESYCESLMSEVLSEIQLLYSLVGVEVTTYSSLSRKEERSTKDGEELYNMFPDIFDSPEQAEATLKWWYGSKEDLIRELRDMRVRRRYERRASPETDPEVVVEDGWGY